MDDSATLCIHGRSLCPLCAQAREMAAAYAGPRDRTPGPTHSEEMARDRAEREHIDHEKIERLVACVPSEDRPLSRAEQRHVIDEVRRLRAEVAELHAIAYPPPTPYQHARARRALAKLDREKPGGGKK